MTGLSLGLGLGLGNTAGAGGGGGLALPAGGWGYWDIADYDADSQIVPNYFGSSVPDPNIMNGPRRYFSSGESLIHVRGGATFTDNGAAAPDASMEATTIVSAPASTWYCLKRLYNLPVGTYTLCATVKDVGSDFSSFYFGRIWESYATKSFDGTNWTRVAHTFTIASSPASTDVGIRAIAGGEANFILVDMELFEGSADLNTNWASAKPIRIQNGDLFVGRNKGDVPTITDGRWTPSVLTALQLPAYTATDALTVSWTAKRRNATIATWENFFQQIGITGFGNGYDRFSCGPDVPNGPSMRFSTTEIGGQGNDGSFGGCQENTHACITYDETTMRFYINGDKIGEVASTQPIPTLADFFVAYTSGAFSNYDIYNLGIWPSALSAEDVRSVYTYATRNITMPAQRVIFLEGDSIMAQSHPFYGYELATPAWGWRIAVSGSTIAILETRAAAVDARLTNLSPGATPILSVLIGANDLEGYSSTANWLAALASYCDDRRAAGWKVIVCTVLPWSTHTTHNARRAVANAEIIASWVGVHCDAVADFGGDAIMGPDDSQTTNPTYWADLIHPSINPGHLRLAPILAAAIDTIT